MSSRVSDNPFSVKTIAIILAISIVAFGAVVALSAWAPELRDRNRAGDHPFSTSAIGYNGLYQLLESQGFDVSISRQPRLLEEYSYGAVNVITLSTWGMTDELEELDITGPALIVLPKWTGTTNPLNRKRQLDTKFASARRINDLLSIFDSDAEIGREEVTIRVDAPFGRFKPKADEKMQIIISDNIEPLVKAGNGMLLGYLDAEEQIIILSDPDMLNTFGLAEYENAKFTTGLLDWMTYEGEYSVRLDASLHGFERTSNLLQMALDVPFIGATLTGLAAVFLLGWAAAIRFGSPEREGRVFALGKQALADNSAGLVEMARRETRMAPGYLALTKRRLLKDIGAPKNLTDEQVTHLLDRLGTEPETGKTWSQMSAGLSGPATNREDLMNKARALFRWRKLITGRSTNGHQ